MPDEKIVNPDYTNHLISVLNQRYSPASSPSDSDEMLTTVDLIEEISDFADTTKEIVFDAMIKAGFKIHNTGAGFVWLLKSV